ncbi:MAG: type II secretion system protein [Patescibacteria group bacterium]
MSVDKMKRKGFILRRNFLSKKHIKVQPRRGFTLIELLVVMAILGILSSLAFGNFRVSQMKSRDAKRKADLGQMQRALEMYYNDKGRYPPVGEVELTEGNLGLVDANDTIYIKEWPTDPSGNPEYCYLTDSNGTYYGLYARLENGQDPDISAGLFNCGTVSTYNYDATSPNYSSTVVP